MTVISPSHNQRLNPYVGPRAFETNERLYGRDVETRKLVNLLVAERLVLLYSPSGAGKTSLIQAALLPKMRERKFHVRQVIRVNREPAVRPTAPGYNRYIFSALSSLESGFPPEEQIPQDELVEMSLAAYLERRPKPDGVNFDAMIFDQFEEILTLDPTDQDAKRAFFEQVGEVLSERTHWALFSMREDYVAGLDPYLLPMPTRLNSTFRLDLLGVDAACQAIQNPARESGIEFDDAAALELVNDLRKVKVQRPDGAMEDAFGPYVEPVQLQVVCYRLWESLEPDEVQINSAHVTRIGNVSRALAEYYALRVAAIAEKAGVSERAIRQWFEHELITESGLRGSVLMGLGESKDLDNRAIFMLENAHLVRAEKRSGAIWFELSHDRLIEPVRRNNAAWFDANLSLLQRQAALWEKQDRSEGLYLRDQALADAEAWAADCPEDVSDTDRAFLEACQKNRTHEAETRALAEQLIKLEAAQDLADAEKQRAEELAAAAERERRLNRWMRVLVALTGIAAVAAIIFGSFSGITAKTNASLGATNVAVASTAQSASTQAVDYAATARDERQTAVAAEAIALSEKQAAVDAQATADAASAEAAQQRRLAEAQRDLAVARNLADEAMNIIDAQPDLGLLLALESTALTDTLDARSVILDGLVNNPYLEAFLPNTNNSVNGLAFSPDGKQLASVGYDQIYLWDIATHQVVEPPIYAWSILDISYSPDGRWLASVDQYGAVNLWDTETGSQSRSIYAYEYTGNYYSYSSVLEFSPDSQKLAIGGDYFQIMVWDIAASQVMTITTFANTIKSLAFSPDGQQLAFGDVSGLVAIWDLDSRSMIGQPLINIETPSSVNLLKFIESNEGLLLWVIESDGELNLWSVETQRRLAKEEYLAANYPLVALHSSDEPYLLNIVGENISIESQPERIAVQADYNGQLLLWTSRGFTLLAGHSTGINSLAISPDGSLLASGGSDGTIILWHTAPSGLYTQPNNVDTLYSPIGVAFAQSGGEEILVIGSQTVITTWNVTKNQPAGEPILPFTSTVKEDIKPYYMEFSPDGQRLVSTGSDGALVVWDLAASTPITILQTNENETISWQMAVSPDGATAATAMSDGSIVLWDLAAAAQLEPRLPADSNWPLCLAFSPDGKILAIGYTSGMVWLWNLESGAVAALSGHTDYVRKLAFSPDGKLLASASDDGSLRLWRLPSGGLVRVLGGAHKGYVFTVAFSPDGQTLASGGRDAAIVLWDAATGAQTGYLAGHTVSVISLAFSPAGDSLLSAATDGSVLVWNLADQSLASSMKVSDSGEVLWVAFSPDTQIVAAASEYEPSESQYSVDQTQLVKTANRIRRWEIATRQPVGVPLLRQQDVLVTQYFSGMAVSPDGSLVAAGSDQGLIGLYDLSSRQPITAPFTAHDGSVTYLAFSFDSQILISSGADSRLFFWDTQKGQKLPDPVFPGASLTALAASPASSLLAAGSESGEIFIWELPATEPYSFTVEGHSGTIYSLAFSKDGSILASGDAFGTVLLHDARTGRLLDQFSESGTPITSLAFDQKGKVLAMGTTYYGSILWDVTVGKRIGPLEGQVGTISGVAFNRLNNVLVSSSLYDSAHPVLFWNVDYAAWETLACRLASRNLDWLEWQQYLAETGSQYHATCPDNPIDYTDIVNGYLNLARLDAQTGAMEIAVEEIRQAYVWSQRAENAQPAADICVADLPDQLRDTQILACYLAAERTEDGMTRAGYLMAAGDTPRAVEAVESVIEEVSQEASVGDLANICYGYDLGEWYDELESHLAPACILAAELTEDPAERIGYYIQANNLDKAAEALQQAVKEAVDENSSAKALQICLITVPLDLVQMRAPACVLAGDSYAGIPTAQLYYYDAAFDSAKVMAVITDAISETMAANDYYGAQMICELGAKYGFQADAQDACLYVVENAYDHLTRADYYALSGDREQAASEFDQAIQEALAYDDVYGLRQICAIGSLDGFAELVMPACERMIELAEEDPYFREVHALALALSGDYAVAIEEFQYVIDIMKEYSYNSLRVRQYRAWIESFRAGINPFDTLTLFEVRKYYSYSPKG